jgi:ferrous iron transport protein A
MFVVLKMIFNSSKLPADSDLVFLSDLPQGDSAILGDFDLADNVAEHLMNLGFIPGTEVTAAQSGPGGDPRVYRVERTEVALRRDLTDRIVVELLPAGKPASSDTCPLLVLRADDVSAD